MSKAQRSNFLISFCFTMDFLLKDLDNAVRLNHLQPNPLSVDPFITHMSFADDILIFLDGSEQSLEKQIWILKQYYVASGLKLNPLKIFLFF